MDGEAGVESETKGAVMPHYTVEDIEAQMLTRWYAQRDLWQRCRKSFIWLAGQIEPLRMTFEDVYVSFGWEFGQLKGLIVQVHLLATQGFKSTEKLLSDVLEQGFVQTGSDEDADFGYRGFTFTQKTLWGEVPLTIRIWPNRNSQVCLKEETKEERVVAKFVCKEV